MPNIERLRYISLPVACPDDVSVYRFTALFDLLFSRYLDGNQLTELPESLLSATTQLQLL